MDIRMKQLSSHIKTVFSGRESGAAFIAVLTFLILGAIIIVPLLGFMITGLRAQQSHEQRTTELYSADAGVEYAIWQLQNGGLIADNGTALFTGTRCFVLPPDPLTGELLNGDNVTVCIENENNEGEYFKIVSDATDIAAGSMTRVRARVKPTWGYQGNFFANGITSLGDVYLFPKTECNGDVQCVGTLTLDPGQVIRGDVTCGHLYSKGTIYGNVHCDKLDNRGTIYGNVQYATVLSLGTVTGTVTVGPAPVFTELNEERWPTEQQLTDFYLSQVDTGVNYPNTVVSTCGTIGPLYMGYTSVGAPRNLTIDTKRSDCEVRLDGTIFVTGNLSVTAKTLVNLNGQTIYCLGDVYFAPGSYVKGSGVIIAIGTVTFQPNIVAGDTRSTIVRYNGTNWTVQTSPVSTDLNGVWGASATNVFAVGDSGTVLVTSNGGTSWTAMTSNIIMNLYGVWGTAASDIFAVGGGGTILHYNGTAWSAMTSGVSGDLNDVWGSVSDNVVYAVGDGGTILQYKQGAWTAMANGSVQDLNGVWGSSGSDVYAVGDGGTVRHYDGNPAGIWTGSDSGTTMALQDVWGSSASNLLAVGQGGMIMVSSSGGSSWTAMTSNSTENLNSVWGTAANSVFAVGDDGAVLRYNGTAWTAMTSGTNRNLNDLWGSSSSNTYAVGDNAEDFVFLQSVTELVDLQPGGEFHGSIAGSGEVELSSGSDLMAPEDAGNVNFPRYRWMSIDAYIIEQH
jgi:cytoskeletal protein CcmA (bactofilin family)